MKNLSAGLSAHLASGTTTLAWCWRITRADGVVLGFTNHDSALSFGGVDYEPESGFAASEIRAGSELNVDSQDAQGVLSSDRITEADIIGGLYDAAEVEVWRVNWQDTSERVLIRRGAIGQVRRGKLVFTAEVRSLAHVLEQSVGRTFQYSCDALLGDGRCGVALGSYTQTSEVGGIRSDRLFRPEGLGGFAIDWFTGGVITWTSGANAGRQSEVMLHSKEDLITLLTLLEPPPYPMASGDTFEIVAGCDKQVSTCGAKFSNVANFRGFPHIPGQDTVMRYAKKDRLNDGSPL